MNAAVLRPTSPISQSLLLHMLGALLAFLALTRLSSPREASVPIEVRIVDAPAPAIVTTTRPSNMAGSAGGASPARARAAVIPLASLGLRFSPLAPAGSAPLPGGSFDFKRESRTYKLADFLFRQIDQHLSYPPEFKSRKWTGEVTAWISFTGQGDYLENATRYEASSDYFKVLVARTLRAALQNLVPPAKLAGSDGFQFECHFQFTTEEPTFQSMKSNHALVMGNRLHFHRSMTVSRFNPTVGPLQGFGMTTVQTPTGAQVAPVAQVDAIELTQKILGGVTGKPAADDLQKYRDDPAW